MRAQYENDGQPLESIGWGWLDTSSVIGCLHLPKTLKKLGWEAFRQRDIKNVVFEGALKELPYQAFYLSGIQEITYPKELEIIGYECFRGSELQEIKLPDTVRIICDRAFYAVRAKGEMILPECVEVVGNCAFYAAKQITDIYVMNPKTKLDCDIGEPEWDCAPCFAQAGFATEAGYARIHGYPGSTAEDYCKKLNIMDQFVSMV